MMSRSLLCGLVLLALVVCSMVSVEARRELDSQASAASVSVLGESITVESEPHVLVEAAVEVDSGVGQACASAGRNGVCKNVAQCSGQTVSGLCAGTAAIKCCLNAAAPAAAAASSSSSSAAFVGGAACSANGAAGKCGDKTACGKAGGKATAGKCAGAANIQCCTFGSAAPAAAAPAQTPAAAPASSAFVGGAACLVNGVSGKCGDKTACGKAGGKATSGKCAGAANIQCCTFATGAASSSSTAPVASANKCTFGGVLGTCGPRSACTNGGKIYTGLCPGSSTSVCCIGKSTAASNPGRTTVGKNRPKIVMTTLQRLSENQHTAKWLRFKNMRGRVFATKAKEQAAYLIFRENRVRLIWLNDNYGQGYVLWASTSPHMDVPSATFKKQKLTMRLPTLSRTPISRSFLELGQAEGEEHTAPSLEAADMQTPEWAAFVELAESQYDNDFAAIQLDEQRAASVESALIESEAAVSGARPCTSYDRPGYCRLRYTCRTTLEYVATDIKTCPSASHRCCMNDKDDLPDDSADYAPSGPVAPPSAGPGTAKITGTFEVDYRSIMQPVRNQEYCGSCWAHSAVSTLEAGMTRSGLSAVPLSTQWLVDCDTDHQNGCQGGNSATAFTTLKTRNIATEAEYPYTGKPTGSCTVATGKSGIRVKESGLCTRCPATTELITQECNAPDEVGLLAALKKYGPLSVSVDATNWQSFDGGIYPTRGCKHAWSSMNHAVVLVGYGEENGTKFWLVQNSWRKDWGEEGFMRIEANVGNGCGVANYAAYAIVEPATAAPVAPVTP